MKARPFHALASLLVLALLLGLPPQPTAAMYKVSGGVNILSVLPKKICVGDTITLHGAASAEYYDDNPTPPLAWLQVTHVSASAQLGQVTPGELEQLNDGFYFDLTYKAVQPGSETIRLVVNNGVAATQETFEVEEKCDYDAFITSVMHLTADLDDMRFESITHVTGTGQMKRDRQGSHFYQGDGKWHLEEIVLSKPPICVEYYSPPLIVSGPFELDGRLSDEGDEVDVILSFLPDTTRSFYHGETVCVDENGEVGTGYGIAQGGDPSLASKVNATFLTGGGTQSVLLEGKGMDMVQSVADLDYTAALTLIPR